MSINWEALAAVARILSAVGVLVSLIYLPSSSGPTSALFQSGQRNFDSLDATSS